MPSEITYEPFTEVYEYNASGLMIYQGWARPGVGKDAVGWRIVKYTYDGSGLMTDKQWANASREFDKEWDERSSYNYS